MLRHDTRMDTTTNTTTSHLHKVGNAYATLDLRFRVQRKTSPSRGAMFLFDAKTGTKINLPATSQSWALEVAEQTIAQILDAETDHDTVREMREVVATEILHLASKMPYAMDDDARGVYDYLVERFGLSTLIRTTGIVGHRTLMDRAIIARAAAENAVTSQEVAA